MIGFLRSHLARAAEVRELRDTVVEQAAEIIALQEIHRTRPPVDWTPLAASIEHATWWNDLNDPATIAYADQALASWRTSFAQMGIDVDDEHDLRVAVGALVAAAGASEGFACWRARSPFTRMALHDHTIQFVRNSVTTLLQFRPKETGDGHHP